MTGVVEFKPADLAGISVGDSEERITAHRPRAAIAESRGEHAPYPHRSGDGVQHAIATNARQRIGAAFRGTTKEDPHIRIVRRSSVRKLWDAYARDGAAAQGDHTIHWAVLLQARQAFSLEVPAFQIEHADASQHAVSYDERIIRYGECDGHIEFPRPASLSSEGMKESAPRVEDLYIFRTIVENEEPAIGVDRDANNTFEKEIVVLGCSADL